MKKIFGFIAMAIIFVGALTFTSCEKQEVKVKTESPIEFIKDKLSLTTSNNEYDIYTDVKGTQIIIPKLTKMGSANNGSLIGGVNCDSELQIYMGTSGGFAVFCEGSGDACKWQECSDGNYYIVICNRLQF